MSVKQIDNILNNFPNRYILFEKHYFILNHNTSSFGVKTKVNHIIAGV